MHLTEHVLPIAVATAAFASAPSALAEAPQQSPVAPLPPTTIDGACDRALA